MQSQPAIIEITWHVYKDAMALQLRLGKATETEQTPCSGRLLSGPLPQREYQAERLPARVARAVVAPTPSLDGGL